MDTKKEKWCFLGIGGVGMSALAHIALERSMVVKGIDQRHSPVIEALRKKGAIIEIGNQMLLDTESKLVYSSAISNNHPLLKKAQREKKKLYHRSQFLKNLMKDKTSLLVAGTHGKTSTAALLTWTLLYSGLSPAYAIGGVLQNTHQNGGDGRGDYFVVEADESDGSFLNYEGDAAILTNLEKEHLNYWESEEKLYQGFRVFSSGIKDTKYLFWCIDDPVLSKLRLPGQTYGESKDAVWRLEKVQEGHGRLIFSIAYRNKIFEAIDLPLMGKHQALNALAVWALAYHLSVPEEKIRAAFTTFHGIKRRLEKKGEIHQMTFYDDYAHHPTEIKALLVGLKKGLEGRRLVTIFQPHRFSRTRDLFFDFAEALEIADAIFVTDVYSAGEEPILGFDGKALFKTLSKKAQFFPRKELLKIAKFLLPGDVVVTVGAGDIFDLSLQLIELLK